VAVKVSESYRLIDWSYLEELSGGDQEFVQEILETYVDTARELVDSIQSAAKEEAAERALYATHTLKGSSRSIGAERLAHVCHVLEESLRSGDMGSFRSLAPNAESEFVVLRAEIQKRAA
jgi:HPt (histidine-containing phosphotransfer) domain-containing protein